MSGEFVGTFLNACGRPSRSLQRRMGRQIRDQRGTVAISFAVSALPIALGIAAAVDFAGMSAGRAALQRAADNAALSGAAAYIAYTPNDALNPVAKATAASAFCRATAALPSGFTVSAASGSTACDTAQGAVVTAQIAAYKTGTTGTSTGAGCSATQTVSLVAGYTCGFAVTVTATAATSRAFAGLLGSSYTLSVTATAINPFIDLSGALKASLKAYAYNANSLWVYPLLLNAEGQPDFSTNTGALPDTSSCTGDPTQTWCGSYSMLASTKYTKCTDANPCTTDGYCPTPTTCPANKTIFGGSGGVVKNVHASSAVVTATTPLGIAFQSAAGGNGNAESGISYNIYGTQRQDGCTHPNTNLYNTIPQTFDSTLQPIYVTSKKDAQGSVIKDLLGNPVQYWMYPTHWFYSSYLSNSLPPSQSLLYTQVDINLNQDTQKANNVQVIKPIIAIGAIVTQSDPCYKGSNKIAPEYRITSYPSTGNTNCSLYIIKDPTSSTAPYTGSCYTPSATPGQQYGTLSCQNYGKSNFAFFWNDMGGGAGTDDKDYGNGTLTVNCSGTPKILLIN